MKQANKIQNNLIYKISGEYLKITEHKHLKVHTYILPALQFLFFFKNPKGLQSLDEFLC